MSNNKDILLNNNAIIYSWVYPIYKSLHGNESYQNMPEILSIKFKNDYVIVEIDTGESISLPNTVYSQYKLATGKSISNAEYKQLKEESNRLECNRKALSYLSIRGRSSHEMKNYLYKKGFSSDIIKTEMIMLNKNGYIDDLNFAKRFIDEKRKRKTVGKNLLRRELYKKGIAKDIISKALTETELENNSIDEIYFLAKKKLGQLKNKKNKVSKLAFFLTQRGFDVVDIKAVIDRLTNEGFE